MCVHVYVAELILNKSDETYMSVLQNKFWQRVNLLEMKQLKMNATEYNKVS